MAIPFGEVANTVATISQNVKTVRARDFRRRRRSMRQCEDKKKRTISKEGMRNLETQKWISDARNKIKKMGMKEKEKSREPRAARP